MWYGKYMVQNFHHFFLPHKHKKKHRKAHLLSMHALTAYVFLFIFMQVGFLTLRNFAPGVLGTSSSITKQQIIDLTNQERNQYGDAPVKENPLLDKAAEEKAQNMFADNYWAHINPKTGQTPWYWMQQAGYGYIYAGENLARGYSTSQDVMNAWMASKMGHKENVLGTHYQEIGVAVEDGVIDGEKTTLVVQMFGAPINPLAKKDVGNDAAAVQDTNKLATNIPNTQPAQPAAQEVHSASVQNIPTPSFLTNLKFTINPYSLTRNFSIILMTMLGILAFLDLFLTSRRNIAVKLHLRHLPHAGVFVAAMAILLIIQAGSII